jgi:hypothetical protein
MFHYTAYDGAKKGRLLYKNTNNFVFFQNLPGVIGKDYKNTKDVCASRSEL